MSARSMALIAAAICGLGLAGYGATQVLSKSKGLEESTSSRNGTKTTAKPHGFDDDAARTQYLTEHVVVSELVFGPDTKTTVDGKVEEVGGLWRFSGKVQNNGDRLVRSIRLVLQPLGNDEKVLSSFFEDILAGKPLLPGSDREFKLLIPAKKEYSGKYLHRIE